MITIKSLYGDFEYPIYFDFDVPVTVQVYNEIAYALAVIGFRIMLTVCDQGPRNEGLAKKLGITLEKYWVTHPYNEEWSIYFTFDVVHCMKNFRNNFLDFKIILKNGIMVSVADVEDLYVKCMSEVNSGHHLNPKQWKCVGIERQCVSLLRGLVSEKTSDEFERNFPEDEAKMAIADEFRTADRGEMPCILLNFPFPFRFLLLC